MKSESLAPFNSAYPKLDLNHYPHKTQGNSLSNTQSSGFPTKDYSVPSETTLEKVPRSFLNEIIKKRISKETVTSV